MSALCKEDQALKLGKAHHFFTQTRAKWVQFVCVLSTTGALLVGGAANAADASVGVSSAALETAAQRVQPTPPVTRSGQSATLLPSGQWLLLGGVDANGKISAQALLANKIGDAPVALTTHLVLPRINHTATVLADGSVLIAGGSDAAGQTATSAERFNPTTQQFVLLSDLSLTPRSRHTATLMMDGRVLLVGGLGASNQVLRDAEIFNPATLQTEKLPSQLDNERFDQWAALLPSDYVLFWGGRDHSRLPLTSGELFDAEAHQFKKLSSVPAATLPTASYAAISPAVQATLPIAGTKTLAVDTRFAIRFNKPLLPSTISDHTISLIGSSGSVKVSVVAAESGLLAFVTPTQPLLPGSQYTLFIQGVQDAAQHAAPFTALSFHTATLLPAHTTPLSQSSLTVSEGADNETWRPTALQQNGEWRSGNSKLSAQTWPQRADVLRAIHGAVTPIRLAGVPTPDGKAAIAGQVLRLNGRPLANVTLSIGSSRVTTSGNGEFLLTGLPAGSQALVINGETADSEHHHYGRYEYHADLKNGVVTALPFVIWMTPLDDKNTIPIASPTQKETVITNPQIPGLELHIPAGTVIRDAAGGIVTQVNITPIPVDQPPFPLPNFPVPVYFTIQPGGAHLLGVNTKTLQGARLIYPNYSHAAPGARIDFWNYDSTSKGWYVYGQGNVTADGKQVIPDKGVVIYEFSGAMVSMPSNAPPEGPPPGDPCQSGDPVDCYTGLFIHDRTDLVVNDTIPLEVRRVYRNRDTTSRSFGVGTSLSYDIYMIGNSHGTTSNYDYQDMILPDGGRVHYPRTSAGTSYADAVYTSTTPGKYYGSVLRWGSTIPGAAWGLTLLDGTTYGFPDSDSSTNPRSGAIIGMRDRYGRTLTFTRSSFNLTKITSPNGRSLNFTYDTSNRITQASDNIGRTITYQYDGAGNLASATDPNGKIESYTYDTGHQMLSVKDRRGNTMVTNIYDANGRVQQQTYADATTASFNYTLDVSGRVTQTDFTDERGIVKRVQFNTAGYPISVSRAFGTAQQQTLTRTLDPTTNLVQSETDSLGRVTAYQYDSNANVTQVTLLQGTANQTIWKYTYDPTSREIASVTDPLNHTTQYLRDSLGNLVRIQDALNNSVDLAYNAVGQVTSVTRYPGGIPSIVTYSYAGGDLLSITDPLARTTQYFTDSIGRVLSIKDPLGNLKQLSYDVLSRVTKTTDPLGQTVQLGYDANGNLTSFTDSKNNITQFAYDARNRLTSKTDPLAHSENYQYDAIGNLKQITDRNGQVTGYTYDFLNRPSSAGFGATSANPTTYLSTVAYTLDAGNRLTTAVDSVSGTVSRSFDGLDRMTQEQSPQGTVNYTYYANNLRQSMTVQGQTALNYTYDNANRLTQIAQGSAIVGFTYDTANRRTMLTLPSGVQISYGYDNANELTSLLYQNGATNLGNITYGYDSVGRRTSMGGSLAQVTLPTAVTSTTINTENQVTNWGGQTSAYDNNGAMTTQGALTYVWDERQRLAQIKNGSTVTASFNYDAFNRRIGKTIGGSSSSFVYDGWQMVQTQVGSTKTYFLTGLRLDEVFRRGGSTTNDFLADGLGSTIALVTTSGAISTQFVYESYGKTGSSASATSIQYAGRENDTTGLYYYRNRYYSPSLNRFISEDPMGFAAGQNLAAYVNGNPLSYVDPLGLAGLPDPNGTVPGGPWSPAPGQPPGAYYGPKQPAGPKSICRWVPAEGEGGPPGSDGYWKTQSGGSGEWQRYNQTGQPISPDEAHPGSGGAPPGWARSLGPVGVFIWGMTFSPPAY